MSDHYSYFSLCVATFAFGLAQTASAEEVKYQLAYKFQAGQFYHYDSDDQADITTQYGDKQSKLRQHTQVLKSYRVVTVDEHGSATIEPIMELVKMASQSADMPVVIYDSSKDETPPPEYEKIAKMIGQPQARFQITARGKLAKVTMLVTDAPKNFTDAAQKADPAINLLIILPEQPIKIGDRWTDKYESQVTVGTNLNQPIQLIRSYELIKVTNNLATIQVRTSLLTSTNDPEILRQLVQQTPSGTIEFDIQQGRILNRSFKIDEKVIGAFGQQSMIQAIGSSTERLVDPSLPRVVNNPPNLLKK